MTEPELLVEHHGAVVLATINRPEAYNALNASVIAALRDVVVASAHDPALRVVVVTGAGDKAFSAGADLNEIAGMDAEAAEEAMRTGQQAFRDIETAAVPVIAAVNGLALGGGFELALAATFPLLSTRASLGLPESSLGLIPGYGGTQRLPRAVGRRVAAHVMLTGQRIDADRAYALGLTPLAPTAPDELLPAALEVAGTIARQGPRAVQSILRALGIGADGDLATGLAMETGLAALAIAGVESTEGVSAFLERRSPQFPGQGSGS